MRQIKKIASWSPFPSIVLFLVLCVYGAITVSYFFKETYIAGLCQNYAGLMILSLGMGAVVISGGIDLSIGATASLVNVSIMLMNTVVGLNMWLAMLLGIILGIICGILNGIIVSFFRINSLISTFAFSWIAEGIALWLVPNPNLFPSADDIVSLYHKTLIGIPFPIWLVIFCLIVWLFIMKTERGMQIYAVGGDIKRAYSTGINTNLAQITAFAFSGLCAGIAGICFTGAMGGGFATYGNDLTVRAIAACVVGGIALTGGKGSLFGAVSGGAFLGLLTASVIAANINPYYQGIVTNGIILVSILLPSIVMTVIEKRKISKSYAEKSNAKESLRKGEKDEAFKERNRK